MSTWTDEKHKAAREVVPLIAEARTVSSSLRTLAITLADALDEIERLRALTTITDVMVERACQVYSDDPYRPAKGTLRIAWETLVQVSPQAADDRRSAMRDALEAALTPKENES